MAFQTTSSVHSKASQISQRWKQYQLGQYKLSSLTLAAQLLVGYCYFLMDHTATPAYFSILLFSLAAAFCFFISLFIKNQSSGCFPLRKASGSFSGRLLEILFSFSFLLDAVYVLCGASSLLDEVLPSLRRWSIAPIFVLFCFLSFAFNRSFSLIRLADLICFPLFAILLTAVSPALNQGSVHHFFPIFGKGLSSIWNGFLFLLGNLHLVLSPVLLPSTHPEKENQNSPWLLLGILFAGIFFSFLLSLLYTCIMPFHALERTMTVGSRLLLPIQLSSSIPGWTVFVCCLIFLFMMTYTASLSRCGILLYGRHKVDFPCPNILYFALCVLTLPPAMLYSKKIQQVLLMLYPLRGISTLFILFFSGAGSIYHRMRGRKQA